MQSLSRFCVPVSWWRLQTELQNRRNQNHMTKTKLEKQIADGIANGEWQRWGTMDDLERLYGLARSMGYYLLSEGKIKSRLIRIRGSKGTGRRLIDLRSVERFIENCPVTPTKSVSRRTRNAGLRSAAVRSAMASRHGRATKR
jgi:hypothetical protein